MASQESLALDALALSELSSKRAQLQRLQRDNEALEREIVSSKQPAPSPQRGTGAVGFLARSAAVACGRAGTVAGAGGHATSTCRYPSLSLFLHLVGLLLLFVPLGGQVRSQAQHAAGAAAAAAAAPLDLVLLVPTTSSNTALHASIAAQFHRAGAGAEASGTGALLLVQGGAGSEEGLVGESLHVPSCGDGPLQLPNIEDRPGESWRYHTRSHFTCKLMEGLCAATQRFSPRFVAVASEEALFHWRQFLAARAPALPPQGLVFTRYIDKELHRDGLPPSFWNRGWPILPTFNNSLVLSRDVATSLCTLHRHGKLLLYGPPELFLGGILSTLEGLTWVMEESVSVQEAGVGCSRGITVSGLKTPQEWAQCAVAKAQ